MGQSQRAFEQVKSILGKLDRNIDAARSRRIQDHTTAPSSVPPTPAPSLQNNVVIGGNQLIPPPKPAAPAPNGRSPFGRATPMRLNRPSSGS